MIGTSTLAGGISTSGFAASTGSASFGPKNFDVTGQEPVEHRGYVPPGAVVVPGSRPREFPAGTYQLQCALVIGWRSESTDLKLSLNETLREYGIGSG